MDVSVLVSVFNSGPYIEPCIAGLLGQTMPADRFEMIFIDDGSTDKTPARLDELAAAHPNVIVRHEPPSGWAGRPRNVALDIAQGDYVFFSDHDDWLSEEALERMVSYARETNADVLAPRIVGHKRASPTTLFECNRPNVSMLDAPLQFGLAPHKLFRRAFLLEHKLRYPEGRRYEDQVFVMEAYLLAERIAVLADYPCYHHFRIPGDTSVAFQVPEPEPHVRYVAEVIDAVEAHTEPGELRDLALQRPFGTELLGRLAPRWFDAKPESYQRGLVEHVSRLLNERFTVEYAETYGVIMRTRAAAARAGDYASVKGLSDRVRGLKCRAELLGVRRHEGGWQVELEASFVFEDGSPVSLTPAGGSAWSTDPRLLAPGISTRPDTTDELLSSWAMAEVLGKNSEVNWTVPTYLRSQLVAIDGAVDAHRLVIRGTARLDPTRLACGNPLDPDSWNVRVRMYAFGVSLTTRLCAAEASGPTPRPVVTGAPAMLTTLAVKGRDHHVNLRVDRADPAAASAVLEHAATDVELVDEELVVGVDLDMAPSTEPLPMQLRLPGSGKPPIRLEAVLMPSPSGAVLRVNMKPPALRAVPAGRYPLVIASDPPARLGAFVVVTKTGHASRAGVAKRPAED